MNQIVHCVVKLMVELMEKQVMVVQLGEFEGVENLMFALVVMYVLLGFAHNMQLK